MPQDTILVRYIGLKPKCSDSFPSGILTWNGKGDVQEIPASALPKIEKHPTVWEIVPRESMSLADVNTPAPAAPAPAAPAPAQTEPKYVLVINESERVVLDTIDLDGLKTLAKKLGVPFNAKTKDPLKLAAEIFTNATKED